MSIKINLKPSPGADYFTLREHLYRYNKDYDVTDSMVRIESRFRGLFHIPPDFYFILSPKSWWDDSGMEYNINFLDDPVTGIRRDHMHAPNLQDHDILDLSYSFPYLSGLDFNKITFLWIETQASLGIPGAFRVVFSKKRDFKRDSLMHKRYNKDIYMLDKVMDDIDQKGMDMLLRESNYKAAVLYQMIASNNNLEAQVSQNKRSKTMIAFKCEVDFLRKMEKLGYEFYVDIDKDMANVVLANYATQSKELIEMFTDRVASL